MQALPPLLPVAPATYDATNERTFREALTRYFQQQRTDSAVADPQQSASPIAGRLVKAIGGGVLGLTNLTESGTVLTIDDSVLGTRAVSLASTLAVAGATTLGSLSVAGATVLHSTLQVTGDVTAAADATVAGVLGVGPAPRAGAGDLRFPNNASLRFRNAANTSDVYGMGVDSSDRVLIADSGATLTQIGSEVAIGHTAATSGALRFNNNTSLVWRNAANTANLVGFTVDASDNLFLGDVTNASTQILGGTGGVAFQITSGGGTKWRWLGTTPFDMVPWHNFPSNDNLQSLGAVATRLKSGFFGTSVVAPVLDSGSGNLTLNRAGVLQVTLAASAATFVGTVQGTRLISTVATGTAPLTVASTTVVANLHATNSDQLGGTAAASYALLASPAFTGTPTAPTAAPGTNTTQLATTAFVQAATSALVTGVSSVFGRTGAVVAATNDYSFAQISGTIGSSQVSGAYSGITGVGTLASGAVPASLVTPGTFGGSTDYLFPANVDIAAGALFVGVPLAGSGAWYPATTTAGLQVFGPSTVFTVGSNAATAMTFDRVSASVTQFLTGRALGTAAAPTPLTSGTPIAQWGWRGFDGTTMVSVANLVATAVETFQSTPSRKATSIGVNTSGRLGAGGNIRWTFDADGDLLAGDAVAATGNNTYSLGNASQRVKNIFYGGQIMSSIATGTAPLVVSSTTLVANLHAAQADTSTTQAANNNSTSIATTAYVDRASGLASQSVAAPTLTTSTTGVMMGLALSFTPTRGTKAVVLCTGGWANSVLGDGVTLQLRFGTGSAPANGAALTGTAFGSAKTFIEPVAADKGSFALAFPVTGLSIGTTYWLDVSLAAVTGGNASITDVDMLAWESA